MAKKYKVALSDKTGMLGLMQLLYGEPKDGRVQVEKKFLFDTDREPRTESIGQVDETAS